MHCRQEKTLKDMTFAGDFLDAIEPDENFPIQALFGYVHRPQCSI